jgi:hypothetical protein
MNFPDFQACAGSAHEIAKTWCESTSTEPLTLMKVPGGVIIQKGFGKPSLSGQETARILGMSYPTFTKNYRDGERLKRGDDGKYPLWKIMVEKRRIEKGET